MYIPTVQSIATSLKRTCLKSSIITCWAFVLSLECYKISISRFVLAFTARSIWAIPMWLRKFFKKLNHAGVNFQGTQDFWSWLASFPPKWICKPLLSNTKHSLYGNSTFLNFLLSPYKIYAKECYLRMKITKHICEAFFFTWFSGFDLRSLLAC